MSREPRGCESNGRNQQAQPQALVRAVACRGEGRVSVGRNRQVSRGAPESRVMLWDVLFTRDDGRIERSRCHATHVPDAHNSFLPRLFRQTLSRQ